MDTPSVTLTSPISTTLSLDACKRRARRRTHQRGAVMFIVAMTLAVIAAMGMYALQTASTEVKTAGYIRQQVQTQYLSQFAFWSMMQSLANNGQTYSTTMTQQPDTACSSLFNISTQATANTQSIACHRAMSAELGTQVVPAGSPAATLLPPFTNLTGDATRGAVGLATNPDFYVEVIDQNQRQPPPGYATNSSSAVCFSEVTASTFGVTPTTLLANAGDSTAYLSAGLEMGRARIVFGPVRCTGTN
jgi:type II secretory pathway pseudopilin PulG